MIMTEYLLSLDLKAIEEFTFSNPDRLAAKKFNIGRSTIQKLRKHFGWKKDADLVKSGRFKRGLVVHNKGLKQSDFMSQEAIEKTKKTRFKKGNKPHNTKKDGDISLRNDKTGRQYYWIRISQGKWKMLHVKIWEDANGPLPQGMIVVFKNGNSLDCKLENLESITRKQHALNSQQSDGFILKTLTATASGKYDAELAEYIRENNPELIELKRKQLQLNKLSHE